MKCLTRLFLPHFNSNFVRNVVCTNSRGVKIPIEKNYMYRKIETIDTKQLKIEE